MILVFITLTMNTKIISSSNNILDSACESVDGYKHANCTQ